MIEASRFHPDSVGNGGNHDWATTNNVWDFAEAKDPRTVMIETFQAPNDIRRLFSLAFIFLMFRMLYVTYGDLELVNL